MTVAVWDSDYKSLVRDFNAYILFNRHFPVNGKFLSPIILPSLASLPWKKEGIVSCMTESMDVVKFINLIVDMNGYCICCIFSRHNDTFIFLMHFFLLPVSINPVSHMRYL